MSPHSEFTASSWSEKPNLFKADIQLESLPLRADIHVLARYKVGDVEMSADWKQGVVGHPELHQLPLGSDTGLLKLAQHRLQDLQKHGTKYIVKSLSTETFVI